MSYFLTSTAGEASTGSCRQADWTVRQTCKQHTARQTDRWKHSPNEATVRRERKADMQVDRPFCRQQNSRLIGTQGSSGNPSSTPNPGAIRWSLCVSDERVTRHTVLRSKDVAGSLWQDVNLHWPHLNHVPLDSAIPPTLVRLCVPMAVQLQVEDIIVRLLISSLSFFLTACANKRLAGAKSKCWGLGCEA